MRTSKQLLIKYGKFSCDLIKTESYYFMRCIEENIAQK